MIFWNGENKSRLETGRQGQLSHLTTKKRGQSLQYLGEKTALQIAVMACFSAMSCNEGRNPIYIRDCHHCHP